MRRAHLPLTALRAFEAAARHLSFSAAASELGVTPTAISHQVRELEQACGLSLFRRRPRPIALTEAGERLFPVLCAGFDSFAETVASLRHRPALPPLRVTTTNAFAHLWLVPRLAAWRQLRPDIALELIGTDTPLDLGSGAADLAIRYARSAPPGLTARELLRDRHWPMCSPALLGVTAPVACPGALLRHALIHMSWDPWVADAPTWPRWFAAARLLERGLPAAGIGGELGFREELHAIEAAIAGQGIALCSDVLAARALESGALVKASALSLPGLGFFLVEAPGQARDERIVAFSAWVCEAAGIVVAEAASG